MLVLVVLATLCAAVNGKTNQIQSLDGTWVAKETNYYYEFPATVPGGVYSDLMNINLIGDVFYGFNDNATKWVGQINWTYALNFTVNEGILDHDQVNLVFEGLDTFATIELNNVIIGETQNMFVRYIFDVKHLLKKKNNLKVYFASPVERGLKLNNAQLEKYIIPWVCPPEQYRGECHINMLRKMQASFSWDWGPSFASMGIWKPVYLEGFDHTEIRHVVSRVEEDGDNWVVGVDVYFADNNAHAVSGHLSVKLHGEGQDVSKFIPVKERVKQGEILVRTNLTIGKQLGRLWWPNGYGEQPLYDLDVTFQSSLDSDDVTSKTIKIGFRTVELVQDALETGATFYLKVNGVPIFAKGSNEIPINVLPELGQNQSTIRYLLQSAKDVNMNMLRVWGGGVYESDYFYQVADELGIMIWQDFMFACSLYPASDEFLDNVVAEIDHNIKRLYHHPSIVVWSGNNENEGVLVDNWYGTADLFSTYKADYVKLYITTIKSQFDRISSGQGLFISSSPTNGLLTEKEGWIGESPGNQYWGDVHFYNYAMDPWSSETYPIPRFCSEYGYQSLPFEDSWMTATNNTADLNIEGAFLDWRQHHPGGNGEMALLISTNMKLPDISSPSYSSALIYLSQVYTSQSIKVETEHYRRYRSIQTDDGRGLTMGALYWQLNDVWVAPTWSSIDFTLRWKMLHYFAQDFFADIIVTGHINAARDLQLYTVNDKLTPVEDVSVLVRVYKYDSPDFQPVHEYRLTENLNASSSQLVDTIRTDQFLSEHSCSKTTCFFYFLIQKNATATDNVAISPQNYVFPGKLYDSSLPNSKVKIASVAKTGHKTFDVRVETDNVALFVWLDSHVIRGRFSENGYLQVEQNRLVTFTSEEDVAVNDVKEALTVTHLKDAKWQ